MLMTLSRVHWITAALLCMVSTGCAGAPISVSDCSDLGAGISFSELKLGEPLSIPIAQVNERVAELERFTWYDSLAGIDRGEAFAEWQTKTRELVLRCLEPRDGGYVYKYMADEQVQTQPVQTVASVHWGMKWENPVVLRQGSVLHLRFQTRYTDHGVQYDTNVTRMDLIPIDLTFLNGSPDDYRYFAVKSAGDWHVEGYAVAVILPVRDGVLDPSRAGAVLSMLSGWVGAERQVGITPIFLQ
jgi:hypothetical protein